jgi:hypothetical protein
MACTDTLLIGWPAWAHRTDALDRTITPNWTWATIDVQFHAATVPTRRCAGDALVLVTWEQAVHPHPGGR